MPQAYDIAVKVISQEGKCYAGHRVGDEWLIKCRPHITPGGLCTFAFTSLYPLAKVLMFGGSFPWHGDPDATTAACPDADNPVVFELRRVRE